MDKVRRVVQLLKRYYDGEPIVIVIRGKRRRLNRVIAFAHWVIGEIIRIGLSR